MTKVRRNSLLSFYILWPFAVGTFIFRKSDQPEGVDFYKLQTQGVISSLLFRGTKCSELQHERDIPSLSPTGRTESPCRTPPFPLQNLFLASFTILLSAQGSQNRPFLLRQLKGNLWCPHRRRRHQVSCSSVVIDGASGNRNQVGKSWRSRRYSALYRPKVVGNRRI